MNPEPQTLASSLVADFFKRYPTEAAEEFESLSPPSATAVLQALSVNHTELVLRRLNPAYSAKFIGELATFPAVAEVMDPTYLARIVGRLGPESKATCFSRLSEKTRAEIDEILKYPEGTAGALMTSRVISFYPKDRIATVIERIRRTKAKNLTTIYLVDLDGKLIGSVSLQHIIGAEDEDTLQSISHATLRINEMAPRDEVVELVESNKVSSIPVVNTDGILVGAIYYDDLVKIVQQDAMADLQTMVGVSKDEKALSAPFFAIRKRLPWLSINLVTTFIAAAVVGLFEDIIAQVTALAVLLPVVAGQSGNTGAQAQAVTMRGLALRETRLRHKWRVLAKEGSVGLVNGLAIGIMCSLAVFVWSQSIPLSAVIGSSMVVAMFAASLSGAAMPMLLTALGQDPATSSSILLTTITDIVGFLSFLGLATIFIHYLV